MFLVTVCGVFAQLFKVWVLAVLCVVIKLINSRLFLRQQIVVGRQLFFGYVFHNLILSCVSLIILSVAKIILYKKRTVLLKKTVLVLFILFFPAEFVLRAVEQPCYIRPVRVDNQYWKDYRTGELYGGKLPCNLKIPEGDCKIAQHRQN